MKKNSRSNSRNPSRLAAILPSKPAIEWVAPTIVTLVTCAAFLPALWNQFVDWDDYDTLVNNPRFRGLGWSQLRWMFTTFHMGHYQPLTWITFGLDYRLWGMNPFGYHLTSLLIHAVNTALFYFLVRRLLSLAGPISAGSGSWTAPMAAGLAALFFSIHPLRVESVAWATERRDVLSSLFLLCTVLLYLHAARSQEAGSRWRWLSAALVIYVLSLLSKATGITLPVVLLILDVYPLHRLGGGAGKWFGKEARLIWWEKGPFLAAALTAAVAAVMAQREAKALITFANYEIASRFAQASYGLAFYLWKTAVPTRLSPLYEIPTQFNPWDWPFVVSGALVVLVSVGLFLTRRLWPGGLAVWLCYAVILGPVLGVAQSGPQFVADRYSYVSCLPWAALIGAGFFYLWSEPQAAPAGKIGYFLSMPLAVLILVGLGSLTWKQTQVWHDVENLWRYTLSIRPNTSIAHYNLGLVLEKQGRVEEALEHYRTAVTLRPGYAEAHYNLGLLLGKRGNFQEAESQYRQALLINPSDADSYNNLGLLLAMKGELSEATEQFHQAIQINPGYAKAYFNLGRLAAQEGHLDDAIRNFEQALRIQPGVAEIHENLARALARQGKKEEALRHYEDAMRILKDVPQKPPDG